jgi:hypothetical protein
MPFEQARLRHYQGAVADTDNGSTFAGLRADPSEQGRVGSSVHGHHRRHNHVVGAVRVALVERLYRRLRLDSHARAHLHGAWLSGDCQHIRRARLAKNPVGDDEIDQFSARILTDNNDHRA